MSNTIRWGIAAAVLCAAASACTSRENAADTGLAMGMGASTGASAGAMSSSGALGAPAYSDANVVAVLEEANTGEVQQGKMAQKMGTSDDVKEFGEMLEKDHQDMLEDLNELAKDKNITPNPPGSVALINQAKATTDSLQSASKGAAWDRAFVDFEVQAHQQTIDLAQQMANSTQNSDLRDAIQKALPTLQKHLDRAQDLQQKLGGSAS